MAQAKRRRAINFDLSTEELVAAVGEAGRVKTYGDISKYLESHGFIHRQGSGYHSKETLTDLEVIDLVADLYLAVPHLRNCVRDLAVTQIGTEYDVHIAASSRVLAMQEDDVLLDVDL